MSSNTPLRRRVSVVVVANQNILAFNAVDPFDGRHFVFIPGGKREDGESIETTAERETLEETGYRIRVLPAPQITRRYQFLWNGVLTDCETVFVSGALLSGDAAETVNDASYHRGVCWIPVGDVSAVFAYHSDISGPVLELIKSE